jgi:hypothetical protein
MSGWGYVLIYEEFYHEDTETPRRIETGEIDGRA